MLSKMDIRLVFTRRAPKMGPALEKGFFFGLLSHSEQVKERKRETKERLRK